VALAISAQGNSRLRIAEGHLPAHWQQLQRLRLRGCFLGSAACLLPLRDLRELELVNCDCSEGSAAVLHALAQLPQLTRLESDSLDIHQLPGVGRAAARGGSSGGWKPREPGGGLGGAGAPLGRRWWLLACCSA
jgi:hypothetical protein